MITGKLLAVEGALGAIMVAASNLLNGTAETIILYVAAFTAIGWAYHNLGKPLVKIVRRAAAAVDSLEHLPEMRARLTKAEKQGAANENALRAIIRELGIEDQVRQMDPGDFNA